MTENNKEILLEIENIRIVRNDPLNLTLERLETTYSARYKKEFNSYQFKGYFSNILSALRAIQSKELLIDENNVMDLEGYLKQVQESNDKILKSMEGLSIWIWMTWQFLKEI